ncbi:hypothetical protein [Pseudoalteromonas denitrificans]|jgi:hypothetical protein|uniref:Uncharacterized protein n=1 Tax=Pseudoalteromonas denitrificans DSM 6059 TaxID=1123010 RepID=A0A1I1Q8G8_9GAMM|nr:hypothetical protein [Pseudoalteromonas denitrificans]SFD18456.1 hypothetical protein SAMN02745724_03787 [Pseudoalteromonas denitrificans DSM 6059]
MTKEEALLAIVRFDDNKNDAFSQLVKFPQKYEAPIIEVTPLMLLHVLKLYTASKISTDELEFWADFIDIREDINSDKIEDEIYALSNPELMGAINTQTISKLIHILEKSDI